MPTQSGGKYCWYHQQHHRSQYRNGVPYLPPTGFSRCWFLTMPPASQVQIFQEFLARNGICHITSVPYHPATNELAERVVQTFKEGMKKIFKGDIETRLARFLFYYCNIPHSTTGVSRAKLLLKRHPRSHLNIMRPSLSSHVQSKQLQQNIAQDHHVKNRELVVDDPVLARNYATGPTWLPDYY